MHSFLLRADSSGILHGAGVNPSHGFCLSPALDETLTVNEAPPGRFPVKVFPNRESVIQVDSSDAYIFETRIAPFIVKNCEPGSVWRLTVFDRPGDRIVVAPPRPRWAKWIAPVIDIPTAAPTLVTDGYSVPQGATAFQIYFSGTTQNVAVFSYSATSATWIQTDTHSIASPLFARELLLTGGRIAVQRLGATAVAMSANIEVTL